MDDTGEMIPDEVPGKIYGNVSATKIATIQSGLVTNKYHFF